MNDIRFLTSEVFQNGRRSGEGSPCYRVNKYANLTDEMINVSVTRGSSKKFLVSVGKAIKIYSSVSVLMQQAHNRSANT